MGAAPPGTSLQTNKGLHQQQLPSSTGLPQRQPPRSKTTQGWLRRGGTFWWRSSRLERPSLCLQAGSTQVGGGGGLLASLHFRLLLGLPCFSTRQLRVLAATSSQPPPVLPSLCPAAPAAPSCHLAQLRT